MSWYSKTSSDCHGSTPSRCGQIYRMAAGQDMPVLRPVPSPTSYPTLPILLVYRAACPEFIHSMAVTHPSLLSVHSQPTQYRRTCPLPATPKKECPCLVSSRHRSKRKRLKPDTRSREIRKRNPGIPNHRPKRQERCPKYTRSASLRSLLTTRSNRYRLVSRGGVGSSSKKKPHPPKDDRQPREERQELPCGAATGEGLAGRADGECVNIREADVGAVEAVVLVNLLEARVVGLDKGDVNALGSLLVT